MAGSPAPRATLTAIPANNAERGYDHDNVPPHIRRAAEKSQKALDMMREGKDPHDPNNWKEDKGQEGQRQDAPQARQDARQEPPQARQEGQRQDASQARQEPPQARQEAPQKDEGWEQRYKSLEGQFHQQNRLIRDLQNDLAETRRLMTQAEQHQNQSKQNNLPAGQEDRFDIKTIFSEEEQADFGPEWMGALQKVADSVGKPLQERINQLEGTTNNIKQRDVATAQQQMFNLIKDENIDIDGINSSSDFKEWVNKTDMGSGQLRKDMIENAWNNAQGPRVVYLFKQFLREVRGTEPEARRDEGKGDGRAKAPDTANLADIAAPGKGKGTRAPSQDDGQGASKTFTPTEYSKFFTDKALNRLKMTREEIDSRAAELDQAYREGRIVA